MGRCSVSGIVDHAPNTVRNVHAKMSEAIVFAKCILCAAPMEITDVGYGFCNSGHKYAYDDSIALTPGVGWFRAPQTPNRLPNSARPEAVVPLPGSAEQPARLKQFRPCPSGPALRVSYHNHMI